jgi:hypothetical protein
MTAQLVGDGLIFPDEAGTFRSLPDNERRVANPKVISAVPQPISFIYVDRLSLLAGKIWDRNPAFSVRVKATTVECGRARLFSSRWKPISVRRSLSGVNSRLRFIRANRQLRVPADASESATKPCGRDMPLLHSPAIPRPLACLERARKYPTSALVRSYHGSLAESGPPGCFLKSANVVVFSF